MSWSIGYDPNWKRDVGYGVPAICDHPHCGAEIDRGLAHVCGGDVYSGRRGCGLFFCGKHLFMSTTQLCERCVGKRRKRPFTPTPDTLEWLYHKMTDPSWRKWRVEQGVEPAKRDALMRMANDGECGNDDGLQNEDDLQAEATTWQGELAAIGEQVAALQARAQEIGHGQEARIISDYNGQEHGHSRPSMRGKKVFVRDVYVGLGGHVYMTVSGPEQCVAALDLGEVEPA
jgi:hypothetical protein